MLSLVDWRVYWHTLGFLPIPVEVITKQSKLTIVKPGTEMIYPVKVDPESLMVAMIDRRSQSQL
jgi:hypothetical protein